MQQTIQIRPMQLSFTATNSGGTSVLQQGSSGQATPRVVQKPTPLPGFAHDFIVNLGEDQTYGTRDGDDSQLQVDKDINQALYGKILRK